MHGCLRQRINDLKNYLAHIQLFPQQLPADIDREQEIVRVYRAIEHLRAELRHELYRQQLTRALIGTPAAADTRPYPRPTYQT